MYHELFLSPDFSNGLTMLQNCPLDALHIDSVFVCNLFPTIGIVSERSPLKLTSLRSKEKYEGWNFNSGNYLFTTDTK